ALTIGNAKADFLVFPAWTAPSGDILSQAQQSHDFFHQSAKVLHRQFHISLTDARAIVASCPDCQIVVLPQSIAVNPQGLGPLQLWQMNVSHIPQFGHFRYVRVTIDCFSMAMWATAQ
ncbi:POK6 protein, partial [Thinocorus orbignyianus]|nr:POK6 protein [Thinocorus orbignyianus]